MSPVLTAGQLVSGGSVTVPSNLTLRDTVRVMVNQGIGAVVVSDDTGPIGVFSERDVMRELVVGTDLDSTSVGTVTRRGIIDVEASSPVEAAARLMSEELVRHLIVVDGGSVLGVISARDIVDWYVASEPYREVGRP